MKTTRLFGWLLLALLAAPGYAQNPATAVGLASLTGRSVVLDRGWRFHPGDDPNWAKSNLDDRQWTVIDPSKDIHSSPQVQRAGIGWLRLRITTGPDLPPVLAYIFQSVASDIYLDGRLLYHFGTVSADPARVRAYNPCAAFNLPLRPDSEHVLAVRIAYQPGLDYSKNYLHWISPVLQCTLFSAADIPGIPALTLQATYLDTFKVGISFILFFLHLSFFFAYRQQQANLYAAGMYLLLSLTFLARSTAGFVHSMDTRMVLYYGSMIDIWIPGVALFIFYSLFDLRKGWFLWLAIGSISLRFITLPGDYQWLSVFFTYYMQFELIRISVVATRRKLLGARLVTIGVLCNMSLWVTFSVLSALSVPIGGNEWLFHTLFIVAFLCIPLTLSLRLSLEHGWTSRQLSLKLEEVEELSARNLAQQQYRQQLLAEQNEKLEQQVTERTKELRQQATQLRELDEAKSRFITNLTHEFRTPLSLIISPVEKLLESPALPDAVQAPLQTVDRNARHLLNQVNQLLDIAQLENGRMSLTLQPVRLGLLTAQLVDLFTSPADADQITLTEQTQGDDTPYLMDTDKWDKIVYNLLANALKFTPAGGRVDVQLRLDDGQAQFSVTDTGIGIAADKLPFIFDRFYQANDRPTRSFEGTGVGLALVRELTNLLGGSVVAQSQPGAGSTFTVRLPIQAAPADSPEPEDSSRLPTAVRSPSKTQPLSVEETAGAARPDDRALVLVVEDNPDLCQFMADELATRYRVLTASNGQQGWDVVQQHLPDVVISDVMMPRMDGFELTRLIRSSPATDHIAVVLLTARSTHDSRLEGLQTGADEYLTKPFDLVELRLRLANVVTRRQKLQAYHRQQLTRPAADAEVVASEPTDPFLENLYTLLEAHLADPRVGVEWLADQVAMDRKTLYRKLQSKLRLSPNELIRTYRLRRGSELLRSGKTVTETAYSVGFESVAYFGQCFREQYQMTPTEFANQLV